MRGMTFLALTLAALVMPDVECRADEPVERSANATTRLVRRPSSYWASYRPSIALPESRSTWTALAVPTTPFGLTSGEALTPPNGRMGVSVTRLSDERRLIDLRNRPWISDGEVNIVQVEYVSRRLPVRIGGRSLAFHWSASLAAISLEHGVLENARNWVEEYPFFGEPSALGHFIGGRDLTVSGQDLLGSAPLLKLRLAGKLHLPRARLFGRCLCSAVGVGLSMPAFGWSTSSANDNVQPDLTLAYRLPLSARWVLTGASSLSVPGSTPFFRRRRIDTRNVLFGTHLQAEFWINRHLAVSGGFQHQTPYLTGTGLPMDETSTFGLIGLMWRPNACHVLHLIFAENTQTGIPQGRQRDFTDMQTDSDFALQLGWRYSL